jgi:thiol-disulfide isomerase/thioredoxin
MNFKEKIRRAHSSQRDTFCLCFLFLFVLMIDCYLFQMNPSKNPPEFPERSEIQSLGDVDLAWPFYTLDGEEKTFKDYENKVIFLNIWATWCGACQSELPGIQRLYDSMTGEKVVFMLLSDEGDSTLREFVETSGLTVPVFTYKNELTVELKIVEIPTTYIIDRHGSIVFKHIGAAKWDDIMTRKFFRELH